MIAYIFHLPLEIIAVVLAICFISLMSLDFRELGLSAAHG